MTLLIYILSFRAIDTFFLSIKNPYDSQDLRKGAVISSCKNVYEVPARVSERASGEQVPQ